MSADTHETPTERCGWSARGTRWVCDLRQQTRETGGGNWAMNPRSLWTPLLWGRGSFVSCTVCTFTLNLQWRQPLLHPGGWVWGSMLYGNEFPRASWDRRVTFTEASPIRIAAMEKRLQFRHRHWHILDYTSIWHGTGCNQHFHFVCRAEVDITTEKRLQFPSSTVQTAMSPCV